MAKGQSRAPAWRDFLVLPVRRPEAIRERDWEVLVARRKGTTQQQIADCLGISASRVGQLERQAVTAVRTWYRQPEGQAWLHRRQEIHEAVSGGNGADGPRGDS